MERAREEFLHSIGTSLNEIIASGLFLVLTEINIRYRRELVPGPIVITFEERSSDRRLLSSRQRILVDGDLTAVEAEINMVFMSGTTKRAVLPPPAFARGYLTGRPC